MTTTTERKTLPKIAVDEAIPLDSLRTLVRKTPALSVLGVRIGPVRGYSAEEIVRIREAYREMQANKQNKQLLPA
jgi:hypothetical protein